MNYTTTRENSRESELCRKSLPTQYDLKTNKTLSVLVTLLLVANSNLLAQCGSGFVDKRFDWQSAAWGPAFTGTNRYMMYSTNLSVSVLGTYGTSVGGQTSPVDDNAITNRGGYGDAEETLELYESSNLRSGTITLGFSQATDNVRFSLYDIDQSDAMTITAFNGATAVLPTISFERPATADFTIAVNTITGNGQNDNNADGTCNIRFTSAVTRVIITTTAASRPSFAVTDIIACVPEPNILSACTSTDEFNWSYLTYRATPLPQTFTARNTLTGAPSSVRATMYWTGNTSHFAPGSPSNPLPGQMTGNGGVTSNDNGIEILVDPPGTPNSVVRMNIAFTQPVSETHFSISDIDNSWNPGGNTSRIDRVKITAFNGFTQEKVIYLAESDGPAFGIGNDTLQGHPLGNYDGCVSVPGVSPGIPNANGEGDRGTVNVFINGVIDRIVLQYDEAGGASDPFTRGIELDDIIFCPPNPMPVDLISFYGRPVDRIDELLWQTTNEENMQSYEVEKSTDGLMFQKIGKVDSKNGVGGGTNEYVFQHVAKSGGLNYYRLKQIDESGHFKFSDPIKINRMTVAGTELIISKDLNTGITEIRNLRAGYKIRIMDMSGKIVHEAVATGNTYSCNLNDLTMGVYMIKVYNESTSISQKFMN